jgi:steroid 5-alpha reductase family enzyme
MNEWLVLILIWLLATATFYAGWLWQRRHGNAGIVDVIWAVSLAGAAILLAALGPGALAPRALLGTLAAVWGLRLASHLSRRLSREGEDGRYRDLRAHWQGDQRRWLGFFQLQAVSVVIFALPFAAVAANRRVSATWLVIGVAIWLLGVIGESAADRQLASFRADPSNRGLTCRKGLWRYSRHPNYFFEWLHWFAYVALAVGSPLWALAWIGPLLMLVFLRYLSGIPWAEAHALLSRGDEYRAYQRTTPMLIPWFPKDAS